jgi:hypothetical protein
MKFFLHPQAQEELEQAVLFYKQQQRDWKSVLSKPWKMPSTEFAAIRCCIEK